MVSLDQVATAQALADKLANLSKEALLYIAGYVEGRLDDKDTDTGDDESEQ